MIRAFTNDDHDTTPNELREQIDMMSWQEPLVYSHPHLIKVTAPNRIRSLMEVWHKSSNPNQTHLKDVVRAPNPLGKGSWTHRGVKQHHKVKSTGIPWAYTFGRAADGSAWVFLYQQKLSQGEYFRDRLYYNKLGEILCKRMGIQYLGSDSGVFQRKETFEMLRNVFTMPIQNKLTANFEFDRRYHHAGRKELIRTKSGFKYRPGIDVGNGQGLQYIGNEENLENVDQLMSRKTKAGSAIASVRAHSEQNGKTKSDQKKSNLLIQNKIQPHAAIQVSVLDIKGIDKKYILPPDYIIHVV